MKTPVQGSDKAPPNTKSSSACDRNRKPKSWPTVVALAVVIATASLIGFAVADDPGITISLVSSNQVQITITNAAPATLYEIHRRALFIDDPDYQWKIHLVGTNTQTNFSAFMGVDVFGFFRAQVGTDVDGDGILDWFDANPTNAAISTLFITIDNPTNSAVIY